MNYWILPDTHFGHRRMEQLCGRPQDFEERIFSALSRCLRAGDVLLHLGDFCFGDDLLWQQKFMALCDSFPCRRWLLRGNHDKKSLSWYLEQGWDCVAERLDLRIFGKHLVFSHEPVPETDSFDLNIHGHFHNNQNPDEEMGARYCLISLEHSYVPVSLEKIAKSSR